MKYQAGTVVPWWIKKFILRRKGLSTPTLYKFDDDNSEVSEGKHYDNTDVSPMKEATETQELEKQA